MRFAPGILLLVLLEVVGQCQGVLSGRFPYLGVAFLEEKQAVVILLHQILQFVVLSAELLGLLVENLFDGLLALSGDGVKHLLRKVVFEALSVEVFQDHVVELFVALEVFLAHELDDVVAIGHEEWLAYLVHFEGVGHVLKFLYKPIGSYPRQHAAASGGTWVLRYLLGQLGKVGTVLKGLID